MSCESEMIPFGGGALIYYWFLRRFYFEKQHVKQSFDAYMTEVQKDWKRDLSLDPFFLND